MVSATEPLTFTTLYDQYAAAIEHYIARLVQSPETAQDLAQDVWIKVFRHLEETASRGNFQAKGWLYSVATNTALDYQRRGQMKAAPAGRIYTASLEQMLGTRGGFIPTGLIDEQVPPLVAEENEEQQQKQAMAALLLLLLAPRQRRMLWLYEWRGLSYKVIGRQLGMSVGMLKRELHEARQAQQTTWAAEMHWRAQGRGLPHRFWGKVDGGNARQADRTSCWPWMSRSHGQKVRPRLSFTGPTHCVLDAPRVGWALVRGPLPPWAALRRTCRTPACVNPWHHESVHKDGKGGSYQPLSVELDRPVAMRPVWKGALSPGSNLFARRRALRLRVRDVANAVGVAPASVRRAELDRPVLPHIAQAIDHVLAQQERTAAPYPTGAELAGRRQVLGLSLLECAAVTGVSSSWLWRLENGHLNDRRAVSANWQRLLAGLTRIEAVRGHG